MGTDREGDCRYGRGTADNEGQHTIDFAAPGHAIAARGGRLGYDAIVPRDAPTCRWTSVSGGPGAMRAVVEAGIGRFRDIGRRVEIDLDEPPWTPGCPARLEARFGPNGRARMTRASGSGSTRRDRISG